MAYAAQVALPALVGCLLGVLLGNLLATPLLRQNASAYGVGRLGVPIWVDVAVPVGDLRARRSRSAAAGSARRAAQHGAGDHDRTSPTGRPRLRRAPVARPSAAAPARHDRARRALRAAVAHLLTFAAVLLGATAVTFGVGLTSSLKRLLDGISHQRAQPVQIALPGNGFDGGPQQVKIGPKHVKARRPGFGPGAPQVPTGSAEHAILAAVHAQPGTLHVVAQADDSVSVAGLSQQIPVTAFRGAAAWTGYDLVSGHWYTGPDQVLAPTGFLTQTGTSVGDSISIAEGHKTRRVRIVGEIFDTHNRGLNLVMSWATLHALDPGAVPDQFDVGLRPGTSASGYANSVSRRLGPDYAVELNARGPAVVDAMIGLIGTLALLLAAVAALGVLNTVVLNTRERVHDLGVFKAVGMTPRQTIAMAIAWVAGIGLIAGVIAVPLGIALHDEILPAMAGSVGLRLPASFLNVYGGSELTVLALVGVLIAIAGAIAPAAWAAKIRTATALHTE